MTFPSAVDRPLHYEHGPEQSSNQVLGVRQDPFTARLLRGVEETRGSRKNGIKGPGEERNGENDKPVAMLPRAGAISIGHLTREGDCK